MGNKKNRERLKEITAANEWARVQREQRPLWSDVALPEIGLRRLQFVVVPALEPGFSWDVRQLGDRWRVFRSKVGGLDSLTDYAELNAEHLPLNMWFKELSSIKILLQPLINDMVGCDGTVHFLEIAGDMMSAVRFCWWTEYPPEWESVIQTADKMVNSLRSCALKRA